MKDLIQIGVGVVNTVTVVILAIITNRYARSAQRQAVAAEALVGVAEAQQKAAEFQAKAAQEQSRASSAQASSAQQMINFVRQQAEEATLIARSLVAAGMQRAMKEVEYWRNVDSGIVPLVPIQLVPPNYLEILEHARKISAQGAKHLSGAFDNLLFAERELTIIQRSRSGVEFLKKHAAAANELLIFAFTDLKEAQLEFQTAKT
jgi:hypothetical protein